MNPGDLLCSRYRIEKALAAGGFGETYLAIDLHLPSKPQVVVKHLKPQNNDPATLQIAQRMFEAEAKVLEELGKNSDRIPTLYTYFEDKIEKRINGMIERHSEFYLVQEFIEGQTLTAELKSSGGKLSEAQVIKILQEILAGLQEVHQKDKIHRDLKPDNIIRRVQDGKLVLIDFGAVKEVRRATSIGANVLMSATIGIGTNGYTPGEQWRGNPRPASDVYAVGAIGIQALTGQDPRDLFDDDIGGFRWQHLCQVSPELALILEKMMVEQLSERYKNGMEAAEAIKQFLNSLQPQTTPISPQPPITNSLVFPISNASVQPKVAPIPQPLTQSVAPLVVAVAQALNPQPVTPPSQRVIPQAAAARGVTPSPPATKVQIPQPSTPKKPTTGGISFSGGSHVRLNFLKWLSYGGVGVLGVVALSQLGKYPSTSQVDGLSTTSSLSKSDATGVVPIGSMIDTDLQQEVSSGKNKMHDKFIIKIQNSSIGKYPALKDAVIEGHLESVTKAAKGKKAQLDLVFDDVKLKSGELVPIEAALVNIQIESKTKGQFLKNAGIILGGTVAGHFVGDKANFKHGKMAGAAATAFVLSGSIPFMQVGLLS
jgi:serine/threonine protein kinase